MAFGRRHVRVYRPVRDTRSETLVSHARTELLPDDRYVTVEYVSDLATIPRDTVTIAFDEAQFFGPEIVDWVKEAERRGVHILIAGLDRDSRGEEFGSMKELVFMADRVDKLAAVCVVCARDATRTQRKKPFESQIAVGASELYEPRCKRCHRV